MSQTEAPRQQKDPVGRLGHSGGIAVVPSTRKCWTCGASMERAVWEMAACEPSDEDLRVCPTCHNALEWLPNARQIANMIRYVAGIPTIDAEDDTAGPRAACPECGMGGDVGGTEPNPIPF